MNDRPAISGTGGLNRSPKVGEMTHGGFRSNRHHEAMEQMADERDMARGTLTQTDDAMPASVLKDGVATIMGARTDRGEADSTKVSPWSKGK